MSCCRTCDTCPLVVCTEGGRIDNTCNHGMAVCPECRPGDCAECADEQAREDTDHDAPHAA